jgi:hypothetical protein
MVIALISKGTEKPRNIPAPSLILISRIAAPNNGKAVPIPSTIVAYLVDLL